ncbi:MAG: HEAT repeat domain-containing protein [Scytolyngbya sp. HA4215-MV1]|jgi:HEAT repeat protein|nr:HEAT repeat domain-containing protein [Scytolyngbya sp. HA4215-MV1]
MKPFCKFAKWALVGLSVINILGSQGQIIPILFFLAAIATVLPPTESLVTQKLPWLEKAAVKAITWLALILIGSYIVVTPEESLATAKRKIAQLEVKKNIPELVTILKKQNDESPLAAEALGNIGDKKAIEPLVATVKTSTHPELRQSAIAALGNLPDPRTVSTLTDTLSDPDPTIQQKSKDALKQLVTQDPQVAQMASKKDVKGLITILEEKDYRSSYVAELLGKLGDKQAVEPLIDTLKTAPKPILRQSAAIALGTLGDERAAQPLINSMKDKDSGVKESAGKALKQLAAKDPKIVDQLLPGLKQGDEIAKAALISLGEPAVDPVIGVLQDLDTSARSHAIEVLEKLGNPRAVKPLVANLTDWDLSAQVGKALATLKWNPQSDADRVHQSIALRKGEDLRKNWSLTRQILLKDVESGDSRKIEYGLYAFMSLGNREIVPTLVDLLKSKGDKILALAYLNCGEPTLEKAAEDWATANGYKVVRSTDIQPKIRWGEL